MTDLKQQLEDKLKSKQKEINNLNKEQSTSNFELLKKVEECEKIML